MIICIVAVGFASMVSDTLQRVSITSSLTSTKQADPPYAALKVGRQEMFMMGFQIQSLDLSFQADLSSGPQYFSVAMILIEIRGGVFANRTRIELEPCTRQHWNMIPQFNYDAFGANLWLCLPMGMQLALQGSYISAVNK